jgi:hypothetical protein
LTADDLAHEFSAVACKTNDLLDRYPIPVKL